VSGLVKRPFPRMRLHSRDRTGKERLRLYAISLSCYPVWVLASKTLQRLDNGRRRTSPTQHTHPTPFPPRMCLRYSSDAFCSMPEKLANRSAPQVVAAAPPCSTRRRTSTTPSFPGRNSGHNQAHRGSRVLPWPWHRRADAGNMSSNMTMRRAFDYHRLGTHPHTTGCPLPHHAHLGH
jgi:hypothetical protein